MSTRTEIENLYSNIIGTLNDSPEQAMNALAGDEQYNLNKINAQSKFVNQALLILADKIDRLS